VVKKEQFMNYLIKKGYGPNNGTVLNALNAHGTEHGVILASKESDFSDKFRTEFKYLANQLATDKPKVAFFSLDFATEAEKQPMFETLNRLLTERKLGDVTLDGDVTIFVSAWEEGFPELFSAESINTLFNSNVIDFSSSNYEVMNTIFDDVMNSIKVRKNVENRHKHEVDDSPSR
jgi:hypothetical protein